MSRFERLCRLILLILMFATFWLPTGRGTYVPLWNILLLCAGMALTGEIEPFFPIFPEMIGLPILFLLNMWLLLRPSRAMKILYRISVAFIAPVKWYAVVKWKLWHPLYWGLFAECIFISIGALFEVIFVLLAFFRKRFQGQANAGLACDIG